MEQTISNNKKSQVIQDRKTKTNCYLKPSWTHNGSIRTDLPLTVLGKASKKIVGTIRAGQLYCVGKVYLKTHNGTIRIK